MDISREEELWETVRIFPVLQDKSNKGFEDKDVVKNAWDGVATALKYTETGHYIVLKLVSNEILFSWIWFSWFHFVFYFVWLEL